MTKVSFVDNDKKRKGSCILGTSLEAASIPRNGEKVYIRKTGQTVHYDVYQVVDVVHFIEFNEMNIYLNKLGDTSTLNIY